MQELISSEASRSACLALGPSVLPLVPWHLQGRFPRSRARNSGSLPFHAVRPSLFNPTKKALPSVCVPSQRANPRFSALHGLQARAGVAKTFAAQTVAASAREGARKAEAECSERPSRQKPERIVLGGLALCNPALGVQGWERPLRVLEKLAFAGLRLGPASTPCSASLLRRSSAT